MVVFRKEEDDNAPGSLPSCQSPPRLRPPSERCPAIQFLEKIFPTSVLDGLFPERNFPSQWVTRIPPGWRAKHGPPAVPPGLRKRTGGGSTKHRAGALVPGAATGGFVV